MNRFIVGILCLYCSASHVSGQTQVPPLCPSFDAAKCFARFSYSNVFSTPKEYYQNDNISCIPWSVLKSDVNNDARSFYTRFRRRLFESGHKSARTGLMALAQHSNRRKLLITQFAFYAERNTGSNLLSLYLRRELFGFGYSGNWKHGCAAPIANLGGHDKTHVVILSKSPYSWLLSLYERPYNESPAYVKIWAKMTFSEFLRAKFCPRVGVSDDRPDKDSDNFEHCDKFRFPITHRQTVGISRSFNFTPVANLDVQRAHYTYLYDSEYLDQNKCKVNEETFWSPIEMYNLKLRSYIHVNEDPDYQHFIRFEDLLIDPVATLRWLMIRTQGLSPKRDCLTVFLRNSKGPTKATTSRKYFLEKYYYNRSWTSAYSSVEDINYVNNRLDKEVLKAWKYDLLSTSVAKTMSNNRKTSSLPHEGRYSRRESFNVNECWRCWRPKDERYQEMLKQREKRKHEVALRKEQQLIAAQKRDESNMEPGV